MTSIERPALRHGRRVYRLAGRMGDSGIAEPHAGQATLGNTAPQKRAVPAQDGSPGPSRMPVVPTSVGPTGRLFAASGGSVQRD